MALWLLATPVVAFSQSVQEVARSDIRQRIVTIAPNAAEILYALGASDRIIAVSKFCQVPGALTTKEQIGGLFDPDVEKIIALRPDLIVLRGRSEPVERVGKDLGVAIYFDRTEKLADVPSCVRDLAHFVGRSDRAEQLVADFQSRLDAVRKRVEGRTKPRVLLTASRQPDRLANLLTAGKGSFLDDALKLAGGSNVFGDLDMHWPQVSTESILTHAPEVIIELMPEVVMTGDLRTRLIGQWSALGSIPAVNRGRIFFVTDRNCLIPSLRFVEIVEQLSRLIHPEPRHER